MRIKQIAVSLMAVISAVGVSLAQGDRLAQVEPQSCGQLITSIERHLEGIERILDRLLELSRLGNDQDRERIGQMRQQYQQANDDLHDRYALAAGEVDFSCEECVARACRLIQPKLIEINDKTGQVLQALINGETAIRTRIANAKRIGLAIQTTDRAMFRAAQLAKKTDEGVEAFPGLRRAFELQEQAKQALVAGQLDVAMKSTIRARDMIGETMRMALDSADIAAVKERMTEFWKETEKIIRRLERRIDQENNPKAARLVEMAKQEQAKAFEQADNAPYRALGHAQAARRIVREMVRFHQRAEHCDDRAEILEQRIEQAGETVEESGNDKAAEILQSGIQNFEKGKELCGQDNAAQAAARFDIASKLIAKAVDIAKGNTGREYLLKREIRKTALIVKRAESAAETVEQKQRVENAQELVRKASETLDNPDESLKLLDKATDIAFAVIMQAKGHDANDDENNARDE